MGVVGEDLEERLGAGLGGFVHKINGGIIFKINRICCGCTPVTCNSHKHMPFPHEKYPSSSGVIQEERASRGGMALCDSSVR